MCPCTCVTCTSALVVVEYLWWKGIAEFENGWITSKSGSLYHQLWQFLSASVSCMFGIYKPRQQLVSFQLSCLFGELYSLWAGDVIVVDSTFSGMITSFKMMQKIFAKSLSVSLASTQSQIYLTPTSQPIRDSSNTSRVSLFASHVGAFAVLLLWYSSMLLV